MSQHYHFIGIGGIGMGALASLLLAKGCKVSGSDLRSNDLTANLIESGAQIKVGHQAQNCEGADYVVYSSAIPQDNPELKAASLYNIPVLKRAELLSQLMREHIGITIAGAHGKTTTTSLVSHILVEANLQPTTAVGGIIVGSTHNARLGAGKYFVAEVDESDRSFLHFSPKHTIITNMDLEHVDQYQDWDDVSDAYKQFISHVSRDGMIIANGEDEKLMALVRKANASYKTFGISANYDIMAKDIQHYGIETSFDCYFGQTNLGHIIFGLPGRHNVLNILAAVGMALTLGVEFSIIQRAVKTFRGVKRRFQVKDNIQSVLIIDDYAHHPTEIKTTLEAAQRIKKNRLITVFQPHRYTRLNVLMSDFAQALLNTDHLVITDVYAASEKKIEGVDSLKLKELIEKSADIPVVHLSKEEIPEFVSNLAEPNDLVLTLGAGDIMDVSDKICQTLRAGMTEKALKENSTL